MPDYTQIATGLADKGLEKYGPSGYLTVVAGLICLAVVGILFWMVRKVVKSNDKCEARLETIGKEYKQSMERITEGAYNSLSDLSYSIKENTSTVRLMVQNVNDLTKAHAKDHGEILGLLRSANGS